MSNQQIIAPKVTKWVRRISTAWTAGVEAILHSAILVGKARADCTNEEYALVIERLPFGARMAQMLVKISLDLKLTKHVSVPGGKKTVAGHVKRNRR